jgi:hypothetical protein
MLEAEMSQDRAALLAQELCRVILDMALDGLVHRLNDGPMRDAVAARIREAFNEIATDTIRENVPD